MSQPWFVPGRGLDEFLVGGVEACGVPAGVVQVHCCLDDVGEVEAFPVRTAARFLMACTVCSSMVVPTIWPVTGSCGVWPAV